MPYASFFDFAVRDLPVKNSFTHVTCRKRKDGCHSWIHALVSLATTPSQRGGSQAAGSQCSDCAVGGKRDSARFDCVSMHHRYRCLFKVFVQAFLFLHLLKALCLILSLVCVLVWRWPDWRGSSRWHRDWKNYQCWLIGPSIEKAGWNGLDEPQVLVALAESGWCWCWIAMIDGVPAQGSGTSICSRLTKTHQDWEPFQPSSSLLRPCTHTCDTSWDLSHN